MFTASAALYDLIYSGSRDYASEAAQIAGLIRRDHPTAQRVLDVACGTGEHARLLAIQHGFHVDGLDLDAAFVRIAQQKLPNASFYQDDMITFALSERYDVIICLFSSIGYVRTLENVRRTLERFRAHLAEGGIVLLEPWFPPDVLDPGRISVKTIESAEISICRMGYVEIDGRLSRLRFEYLFGRPRALGTPAKSTNWGCLPWRRCSCVAEQPDWTSTIIPKGHPAEGSTRRELSECSLLTVNPADFP